MLQPVPQRWTNALKIPGSEFSWTTWNAFGKQVSISVQQSIVTYKLFKKDEPIHLLIVLFDYNYSQNINDFIIS